MSNKASNHIKYLVMTGVINFLTDQFKAILMDTGFAYNPDTHSQYADISAQELAAGNGYLQKAKVLAGVAVLEDDINNRCSVTWTNPSWVAAGGPIGPSPGMIIIDETVANDPIVGYVDFLSEYTQVDGGTFTVANPEVRAL
jgi:hypothetical protein